MKKEHIDFLESWAGKTTKVSLVKRLSLQFDIKVKEAREIVNFWLNNR